jgi:hypothetical protein
MMLWYIQDYVLARLQVALTTSPQDSFTTGRFQDFRSFDGVYVLSGLNSELTNSVSSALMETSEICH